MGLKSTKHKDGTKPPKPKKVKMRSGQNNPRHDGSTQSLNYINVGVSPNPNAYSQLEDTQSVSGYQSSEDLRFQANPHVPPRNKPPPVPGQHAENRVNTQFQPPNFEDHTGRQMSPNPNAYSQAIPPPPPPSRQPPVPNKETENRRKTTTGKADSDNVYHSPEMDSKPKVRADRNYESNHENDISFRKGDILQLINEGEVDGWYFVKNLSTEEEGYAHKDWVSMITSVDVESQKCFFKGMDREEAEERLLGPEIELGTYLIRSSGDDYALSLRCKDKSGELEIRHYKVRVVGKGICYIDADSNSKPFSNIVELIKYYTEKPGLRCKLKKPLPQDIPFKDLTVKISDLKLGEKLGTGNFGSVYAGTLHKNTKVAVKSLKAEGSMTVEEFKKEAETMHRLRHPNLVSFLAICEGNCKIYIITERMSKGALVNLLREDTDHTIKFKDLMHMAVQVVEGMCYLEKKGFVHRDLRAANVLVGDGNITKIADFGLARILDNYYEHEEFYQDKKGSAFPYKWTAPEAIKQLKFTVKSDVWSFGILLYEMVTRGDEPYAAMSNTEALEWVQKGNRLKKPADQQCPMTLYNIMTQCWLMNSTERPNFERIKETLLEIKTNA